ncbi:MAG: BatA domain-containing protein [candidate division WOR-3 bacterium]
MKFLNPIYLFGLFLIAVPIIIHLMFKKNLKKVLFSSLLFLKTSELQRLKWLRLKEILALIARCIMVASIFLALARPQYEGKFFTKNKLAAVYLVIDNSFSMHYGKNFENALNQAEKIINNYSSRSIFYVVPICLQDGYNPFWAEKNTALSQLKSIKLSFATGSLKSLYEKFLLEHTDIPKEFVYIGDGQIINFTGFKELTNFYWLQIPGGSNIAIENVSLREPYFIPKDNYELSVNIKNYGLKPFSTKIELTAGNFYRNQESIIPAGQNIDISFSIPSYIRNGIIKIEEDSLSDDNQYYFSKSLLETIKLLIVGDSKYIKIALTPSPEIKTPFEITKANSLKELDIRPYHIILINGIEEITEFELIKLQNFLSQPKSGLILFLGPIIGSNLRNWIYNYVNLEEYLNLEGYVTIKWIDTDYSFFSLFKDNAGLRGVKIFKMWKMKTKSKPLIKLDNNLPFLINQNNIMIFPTVFSATYTDIVYNPNFIPLLHSIIYGLLNKNIDNEYQIDEIEQKIKLKEESKIIKPGFYKLDGETISVNINPVESNLSPLTPEMAKNLGIKILTTESIDGFTDLTNLFLLLLLCSFLFEIIILLL